MPTPHQNPQHQIFYRLCYVMLFILSSFGAYAQTSGLNPGFNAQECEDILKLNIAILDTAKTTDFTDFLNGYKIHYRSPSVGLDNSRICGSKMN